MIWENILIILRKEMIHQTTYKLLKVYKQVYQIVNSIYEYVGK